LGHPHLLPHLSRLVLPLVVILMGKQDYSHNKTSPKPKICRNYLSQK
jgi:hypothetical protein